MKNADFGGESDSSSACNSHDTGFTNPIANLSLASGPSSSSPESRNQILGEPGIRSRKSALNARETVAFAPARTLLLKEARRRVNTKEVDNETAYPTLLQNLRRTFRRDPVHGRGYCLLAPGIVAWTSRRYASRIRET